MFTVTRELYYAEMAAAIFEDLKRLLLPKDKNHCQRVEFLPTEVMHLICQQIREDTDLLEHGTEAYVLAQSARDEHEIESGALIEKRNRWDFGILVAFIPQGLRLPAEDSYDIQTFKTYDFGNVLRAHTRRLRDSLPAEGQDIARKILNQNAVRRMSVERQLKYLLALKHDAATWLEAGAYLFYLNLIPDLKLEETGFETRIDRNAHCVGALTDPDRSILASIENLVEKYQLDPDANNLREHLVSFLRERNVVEIDKWLAEILLDDTWRPKLTFDKWIFKDVVEPGKVEVHLIPLEDPRTGALAKGLKKEGNNIIASTDAKSPIHLKWETFPRKPDNLGHFLLMVIRDTEDDEAGTELLRKTVKAGRTSLKLPLKEIDLEEGESREVKLLIHAKDKAGVLLCSDESEPFYIEGGGAPPPPASKVNRVRNRAEAFLQSTLKYRAHPEVDSEGWEDAGRPIYRIKLKNRDIYRIPLNPVLNEIELRNIRDSMTCGAWQADQRNRAVLESEDLQPLEVNPNGISSFNQFLDARRLLFHHFQEHDASGVAETFDLRDFKPHILNYVEAYQALLDEAKDKLGNAKNDGEINNILNSSHHLTRIDTIHLKVGSSGDEGEVLLLAPTHPLRLLWVLQYQQLLFSWMASLEGVSEDSAAQMLERDSADNITSLNIPSAIALEQGKIYVNSDNVDLYWSILPKGDTPDIRKVVSFVLRLLGDRGTAGDITTITPSQLADKFWRYLKHHPYVSTLRLNVINPGDGLIVLNAIRELQKGGEFNDLNYDIAFYGDLPYEVMGSAFDDFTEEVMLTEGSQPDVDEILLRPNKNPLFPKLAFSKKRVREADWQTTSVHEAHITILIDRFSTKVLTRSPGDSHGTFCLHNLLAEYRADFDLKGESATWSRKVIPNQNSEVQPGDSVANLLYKTEDALLRLSACLNDWGDSLGKIPAIQVELSDNDKHIVSQIHEKSDWVFTIDRNFGIEYFDNPRSAPGVSVRSYLLDYTPEFLDGVGHRLMISTFWLTEIEDLIRDGLKKMGIPGTGYHAAHILDILKSISGRLALKLINNPVSAREIIGLALTRLLLDQDGLLQGGVLIPVDSHIDLFAKQKRQAIGSDINIHRSDLILVKGTSRSIRLNLIEVKFRSGAGGPAEEFNLKEQIVVKNADTRKVLENRFVPNPRLVRMDQEIRNKKFSNLLQFYLERGKRHGLVDPDSAEARAFQESIRYVEQGNFLVEFENTGYIFNLQGISKPVELYKDNTIFVVGQEKIRELLEIPKDVPAVRVSEVSTAETPVGDVLEREEIEPIQIDIEPQPEAAGDSKSVGVSAAAADQTTPETTYDTTAPGLEAVLKDDIQRTYKASQTKTGVRILVGRDSDSGKDVYWDPFVTSPKKLTNQHILIVGKSGAGKTQTASAFLWELAKAGIRAIIFDFQGEYMSDKLTNAKGETFLECTQSQVLDASDGIAVNPFDVPVDPYSHKRQNFMKVVYQVAASLAKIFGLGDIQHAILRDAISQAFIVNGFVVGDKSTWNNQAPSMAQVWMILKQKELSEGGNVRNLNLRIQPLFETGVFLDTSDALGFERVLETTSIVRLSNLATPQLMVAVSRFLLQRIYSDMLARGPSNELRLFAVVDEAHKLSYEETLTELIREARKYGLGILLASQSVKDFDPIIFDMVGTKIALQLEGDDAKIMADNLGLVVKNDRDIARELILNEAPQRALLRSNHYEPYIQVDTLPFWKRAD